MELLFNAGDKVMINKLATIDHFDLNYIHNDYGNPCVQQAIESINKLLHISDDTCLQVISGRLDLSDCSGYFDATTLLTCTSRHIHVVSPNVIFIDDDNQPVYDLFIDDTALIPTHETLQQCLINKATIVHS